MVMLLINVLCFVPLVNRVTEFIVMLKNRVIEFIVMLLIKFSVSFHGSTELKNGIIEFVMLIKVLCFVPLVNRVTEFIVM